MTEETAMQRAGVASVVLIAGVGLWLCATLAPALPGSPPAMDRWSALIAAGDAAATGSPAGGLAPRAAYLLAFHEAQDVLDVHRMLVAATRLERLGEAELACHARRVAREASLGAPMPR
jgi:hypothetical protein